MHLLFCILRSRLSAALPSQAAHGTGDTQPPLRQCQRDCLHACAKGARVIEMACGTGKTRVIKELVSNVSGRVLWALDSGLVLTHALSFSPSSGLVVAVISLNHGSLCVEYPGPIKRFRLKKSMMSSFVCACTKRLTTEQQVTSAIAPQHKGHALSIVEINYIDLSLPLRS